MSPATGESSNGHPYADMPPRCDAESQSAILQRGLHLWKAVAPEATENCPHGLPLGDTTEKLDSLVNLIDHFPKTFYFSWRGGGGMRESHI